VDASGNVFVADSVNNNVQEFSNSGIFANLTFGSPGGGHFNAPAAIAVDGSQNVFVTDEADAQVQKFTNDGTTFSTEWGGYGPRFLGFSGFSDPAGVAVDGLGNVYVTDFGNQTVQTFDNVGDPGPAWVTGLSAFNGPIGVAVDGTGRVIVADTRNNRIEVWSNTGDFSFAFGWGVGDGTTTFQICLPPLSGCQSGIPGSGLGQFNYPDGVAVDANDNLFVTESNNNRVQEFTNTSVLGLNVFISNTAWGTLGSGDGQFNLPLGVAVWNGYVFVADGGNNRIDVFTETGTFKAAFGWGVQTGAAAFEICTSASGCLAGLPGNGLGQFNGPIPPSAVAVAVDTGGNIFVVDEFNQRIEEFPGCQF
jgi:hypothetical protein